MIQKSPYFFSRAGHDVLIFIAVNMKFDDERPSVCLLDLDLDLDLGLDLLKSVIHFETFHGIYIPELC